MKMNLTKLFETQKILRDRINYNEPDRFHKLILALLVELGECAQEWRGFKFWSKDQEPRTFKLVSKNVNGHVWASSENPLLEEYVDGLHFILELGIEISEKEEFDVLDYIEDIEEDIKSDYPKCKEVHEQFNSIFYYASSVLELKWKEGYNLLFSAYYHLGEMLGFTWEQIEQAYYDKNKVNHTRQDSGY
jgi:dimeric dUTPase (all-alpha-NTP-PPase superfamily)